MIAFAHNKTSRTHASPHALHDDYSTVELWYVCLCVFFFSSVCVCCRDSPIPDQCTHPLGMESGNITDKQITASSAHDIGNVGPQHARWVTGSAVGLGLVSETSTKPPSEIAKRDEWWWVECIHKPKWFYVRSGINLFLGSAHVYPINWVCTPDVGGRCCRIVRKMLITQPTHTQQMDKKDEFLNNGSYDREVWERFINRLIASNLYSFWLKCPRNESINCLFITIIYLKQKSVLFT